MVLAIYQIILRLNKITECLKMNTLKMVFTETTMHCKVTCILCKIQETGTFQSALLFTSTISDHMTVTNLVEIRIPKKFSVCIVTVCVFVSSILFWFPQCTHYFWRIFRFLFLERKQDYNVTSVKNVQGCF